MSYRCERCNVVPEPGTPAHKLVVEKRAKTYPARKKANRYSPHLEKTIPDPDNPKKRILHPHFHDPGGEGWEIARELTVCPECAS